MFRNKNGIFYSKHLPPNQIEVIQLISNNNNLPSSSSNLLKQTISLDSKGEILAYRFFEETLMIILSNKLMIYKSFNDKASLLDCSFTFYKEQLKIRVYQIMPLHFYAISLGKTIHLVKIHNNKRIEIKTYRLHSIAIQSILSFEIRNEFTGDNIYMTCRVNYDINSPYAFCIQSFCLPNLESEVITNHNIFFGQSDSDMIKIWTIDPQMSSNIIIIVYTKQGKKYCMFNYDKKQIELKEIEQCLIDHVILISPSHIIFFCDNNKMIIYEMKTQLELVFLSKIDYNKEGKYLMKHKAFKWNNKVYITAFNTDNQLKAIVLNKELKMIDKEEYALKDYSFNLTLDFILKELNDGSQMKIIQGKHCEVMNMFFYNTIIQSIKRHDDMTLILYKGKLEIFNQNTHLKGKPISILTYDLLKIKVLDFDIIKIKEMMFLFVLLTDITHQTQVILFNYTNTKNLIDVKDTNLKEYIYFKCSLPDEVSPKTVFNTTKIFSYISIIKEEKILILISAYGEIKFFSYDENGTCAPIYDFTISFHSCEITEMKNEFENGNDLLDIFRLDQDNQLLSSYHFIDGFIYNKQVDLKCQEIFNEEYIILVLNCGIVIFQLIKNSYTGIRKIIFYEQINKDFSNKNERKNYKESIAYNEKTGKFYLK